MKRGTVMPLKSFVRQVAWVGKQLFWAQVFPMASNIVTKAAVDAVKVRVFPQQKSPFITGKFLQLQTVDGAVRGVTSSRAWAKYAIPKGLPEEGGRNLAIENEPHFVDDFDGEIEEGYGKGTKTLLFTGPAAVKVEGKTFIGKVNYHVHKTARSGGREHYDIVVEGIKPGTKQWEINIPNGNLRGRYAFISAGQGTIVTRMKDQGLQIPKPDYTLRKDELLLATNPSETIVERKIDGSLGNANVQGQRVAFRSHREGGQTYYDRLPALEFIRNNSPFFFSRRLYAGPNLTGTVFQGELTHPDGSARVSGILNSLPQNARLIQQKRGDVKYAVWDILKYKGKDVSGLPYSERRALYEKAVNEIRSVNRNWSVVEMLDGEVGRANLDWVEKNGIWPAKDVALMRENYEKWAAENLETPKQFYERIIRDPLPMGEGVVLKPRNATAQKWDKVKITEIQHFKLDDILEGEGKYKGSAGKMVVENPANGAKGELGSLAVPDEYRQWIFDNRDFLVGQDVKARVQAMTNRGAPRAGVFLEFGSGSEADLLMAAETAAIGTDKTPHEMLYAMKSAAGWRRK